MHVCASVSSPAHAWRRWKDQLGSRHSFIKVWTLYDFEILCCKHIHLEQFSLKVTHDCTNKPFSVAWRHLRLLYIVNNTFTCPRSKSDKHSKDVLYSSIQ